MRTAPAAYRGRLLLRRLGPYVIGCWMACGCDEGTLQASAPSAGTSAGRSAAGRPGGLDTGNRYAATVRIYREKTKARKTDIACSGTVIGPRLVLTAAHCVCEKRDVTPSAYKIKGRTVTGIVTASDCAARATVMTVSYPKTWPESPPKQRDYEGAVQTHLRAELLYEEDTAFRATADLAVIFLTEEVEGITPVKLTGDEVHERDHIILVGYGVSSKNKPERRFGETRVSEVREPVSGGVEIVASEQRLEDGGLASQLISGDSGGACFTPGDLPVLVGVNASTSRNIWGQVSSIFTSVSAYSDWLQLQLQDPRAGRAPP